MTRRFSGWKIICLLLLYPSLAQPLTLNPGNTWNGIFAGKVTDHEITLTGEPNSYALLSWKLVLKGRTLSSGRQDIRFTDSDAVMVTLPLQAPPLKPGISLEAELAIELANNDPTSDKVRHESKLAIFGPDTLLSNRERLKQLDIQLFDPNGRTSKIFDDLKIPYKAQSKSQVGSSGKAGLIVVGTGVLFDRHRGLIDALIERARMGQRVLLLQPVSGKFSISGPSANPELQATALSFSNDDIVQSFAPGYQWISGDSGDRHRLALRSDRQAVLAEIVGPDKGGWDWVDISYGQSGGRFIVCMLPFDQHIYQGPVPQIILGHLLAYANGHVSH